MLDHNIVEAIVPVVAIGVPVVTIGWIVNNWLRMRHGYPLESAWGKAIHPKESEANARVQLLAQENAQLRAEIGAIRDRLASVERIVTDQGYDVARQIDSLREARQDLNGDLAGDITKQ